MLQRRAPQSPAAQLQDTLTSRQPTPPLPAALGLSGLWSYLGHLTLPRVVLWCYLLWYFATLHGYFDSSPSLWLNSLGISAIIGTGLLLSTAYSGPTPTRLDRWQRFRLYLMPLCVSSFAATIKGHGFVLIFHPTWEGNAQGAALILGFLAVVGLAHRFRASEAGTRSAEPVRV